MEGIKLDEKLNWIEMKRILLVFHLSCISHAEPKGITTHNNIFNKWFFSYKTILNHYKSDGGQIYFAIYFDYGSKTIVYVLSIHVLIF